MGFSFGDLVSGIGGAVAGSVLGPIGSVAGGIIGGNVGGARDSVFGGGPRTTASFVPTARAPLQAPNITIPESLRGKDVSGLVTAEQADILARRKNALQGFNAPQLAAAQAQMALQQQGAEQLRKRELQAQLAKGGVRGGAAAALQARAAQMAARDRGQSAEQLFLANQAQQEKALGDYERTVGGATQFAQRDAMMPFAADLAREQIASAERIAREQGISISDYARMMAEAQNR